MKKIYPVLTLLLLFLPFTAFNQTTRTATAAQMEARARQLPVVPPVTSPLPAARQVKPLIHPDAQEKTTVVAPVLLGSSYSELNSSRGAENGLYCNDSTGLLVHIHNQNTTIWGGGSGAQGLLRYDVSTDGGSTWHLDIGPLNPIYTRVARYPQVTGYNPLGTLNPLDVKLVWEAATLEPVPPIDWDGVVSGVSNVVTAGTPTSTETYRFADSTTLIPAGLCQGLPGEFWYADMEYIGGTTTGHVYIHKGIYNAVSGDVDWARVNTLFPPYDLSYDGSPRYTAAIMEFSPDGLDGWIALLGDIQGDTVYSPVYWHSTDGGDTWSGAGSVDLSTFTWYKDSLQTLWVDSTGNPAGTGKPTCAFDFDLTVDINGNAHFGMVVGNASTTTSPEAGYEIYAGIAKFMADIYTTDGGTTWSSMYLAPVLTFRGKYGGGGPSHVYMDNHPQAARNVDGSKVYFTWVDSDTIVLGFGESENALPNLRGMGWRLSDGYRTCYKLFTDGDPVWDGLILYPSMAPQTLRSGTADKLFTGFVDLLTYITSGTPVDFYTLVHDTWFDDSEFMDTATFTFSLAWGSGCMMTETENVFPGNALNLHACYPNPADEETVITFESGQNTDVKLVLSNLCGQEIAVLATGRFTAGKHEVKVNTSGLASGVYFYRLSAGDKVITKKMVVAR